MALQLDELRVTPTMRGTYRVAIVLRDANGVLEHTYAVHVHDQSRRNAQV
jgi:hypothetical protein